MGGREELPLNELGEASEPQASTVLSISLLLPRLASHFSEMAPQTHLGKALNCIGMMYGICGVVLIGSTVTSITVVNSITVQSVKSFADISGVLCLELGYPVRSFGNTGAAPSVGGQPRLFPMKKPHLHWVHSSVFAGNVDSPAATARAAAPVPSALLLPAPACE